MRVLFLNENIGGHVTVHVGIAGALSTHPDVEAEFLDVPPPGLFRRVLAAPLPGLARLDLDLQPLRHQLAAAAVARPLLNARLGRFDALHVYTQNAALLSTGLVRSRPTVVSTDSTNVRNAFVLPYRYPSRFTRACCRLRPGSSTKCTEPPPSSWQAADGSMSRCLRTTAFPRRRSVCFPSAFSFPTAFRHVQRHDRPRVTFVGRSMERKGGRRLLELHQQQLRDRCLLTLVTQERVKGGLPSVEVRNDVTPGDGKLASILADTDVFVFPSAMDQSPNVVLEAMAAGLPVVALPVAAVPEMVEHGVTGLLVAEGDDDGLVSAIRSLLDDPATARAMGTRGRQHVLKCFDATTSTSRLLEIIHEAVDLHGHGEGGQA